MRNAIQPTRVFTLESYDFFDQPGVNFNYQINSGQLDVFVVDQFGNATRIATSVAMDAGPFEPVLQVGTPTPVNIRVDITPWANQPGLTIEFRTRMDNNTAVLVDDVHIQLGDGSRVLSGEPNPTYTGVSVPFGTVTDGKYQFEVRMAENFFESNRFGGPTLTNTFDTNHRFAEQLSLIAPAGADITAGDAFAISDGGVELAFEFTTGGGVGLGNVPIIFSAADPDYVIAEKIRDAINDPNVQSRLRVSAASSGGIDLGSRW